MARFMRQIGLTVAVLGLVVGGEGRARADVLISFTGTVSNTGGQPGISVGDTFTGTVDYKYAGFVESASAAGPTFFSMTVDGQTFTSPNGPNYAPKPFSWGVRTDWSDFPSEHWYNISSEYYDTDINPVFNRYSGQLLIYTAAIAQPNLMPPLYRYPTTDPEGALVADINGGFYGGTVDYYGHFLPSGAPFDITGDITSISAASVPEPSTLAVAGTAALMSLIYAWRRRKAKLAA